MHLRIKINSKPRLVRLSKIVISLTKRGSYWKDLKGSYISRVAENTDLYKPVLNKIMATCKQGIKWNFVATLNVTFHGLLWIITYSPWADTVFGSLLGTKHNMGFKQPQGVYFL